MQSTDNGYQRASLMKSDDKEENRDEDQSKLSYTGVNITNGVNNMQLNEIMADVQVGKLNLPPMSKPRDKKSVKFSDLNFHMIEKKNPKTKQKTKKTTLTVLSFYNNSYVLGYIYNSICSHHLIKNKF